MRFTDTFVANTGQAPFSKRHVSVHVVVPLLLVRLVENLLALDCSTFVLPLISIALLPKFRTIVDKCVMTEFVRSYL